MTAQVDFSSPFVAARIVTSKGKSFPFWTHLDPAPKSASSAAQSPGGDVMQDSDSTLKSLSFMQEVTIEWQLAFIPIISVTLAPPFRDAIAFLDSELIEWGASTVEVQLGYSGSGAPGGKLLSEVFKGLMLKPEISLSESPVIQINAQGVGAWSLTRHEGAEIATTGETRRALITRLAKGPGGKKDVVVKFDKADSDRAAKSALDAPVTDWTQGTSTYWEAISELADQALCEIIASEDSRTLNVVAVNGIYGAAPKRILRFFDYPQGRLGNAGADVGLTGDTAAAFGSGDAKGAAIYPILSLTSPNAAVYLPASVRGAVMRNINDSTREATTKHVSDQGQTRGGNTKAEPKDSVENPGQDPTYSAGAALPGDPNHEGDLSTVVATYVREGNMGIELEIETMGIPDVRPGEVVAVEGVGKRLGGNRWVIHKLRHSIGIGGFTTALTVLSNADTILTEGKAAKGQVNTKNVEGGNSGSTSVPTRKGQGV